MCPATSESHRVSPYRNYTELAEGGSSDQSVRIGALGDDVNPASIPIPWGPMPEASAPLQNPESVRDRILSQIWPVISVLTTAPVMIINPDYVIQNAFRWFANRPTSDLFRTPNVRFLEEM